MQSNLRVIKFLREIEEGFQFEAEVNGTKGFVFLAKDEAEVLMCETLVGALIQQKEIFENATGVRIDNPLIGEA